MDVARAFTYITEDERWVGKIVIGAVISFFTFLLLPIPLLAGWMVGITRNVMAGVERPLPEWDDFGTLFRDGLAVVVAQFVYTLPFWLLACIAFVATVGLSGLSEVNEDMAAASMLATFGLVGCLALLFLLALLIISPAIVIQYVRTNDFGACFRFGEVVGIARDNVGDILIAALTPFVVSLVLSAFSAIPVIGWCGGPLLSLVLAPYLLAVLGHLYGQIAAKSSGKAADKPV
jgi:hypothetical protein